MSTLGERIKFNRKRNGLNQEQLANAIGVSMMSIRRYENDERLVTIETLEKIAKILKIPVGSLTGDEWDASLADDEVELIADYNKLTPEGKEVARERVRELTEIPRYYNPDHGVKIIKGDERQDDTGEE